MKPKIIRAKLPQLNKVKNYSDFYKYIFKGIKIPSGYTINVMSVTLHPDNEKTLAEHLKKELSKKNRGMSVRWYDSAWAMYWLCYSPRTSKEVSHGYAEIGDNPFVKERDIRANKI
jgi:hypothetical protein